MYNKFELSRFECEVTFQVLRLSRYISFLRLLEHSERRYYINSGYKLLQGLCMHFSVLRRVL